MNQRINEALWVRQQQSLGAKWGFSVIGDNTDVAKDPYIYEVIQTQRDGAYDSFHKGI